MREFAHGFAKVDGANALCALDAGELEAFLRHNPTVTAISSHHLRYPKPVIRHMVIFDCCFLRHPLERLDSVYRYSRGILSDDYLSALARRLNAREFFQSLLNDAPHLISNVQVMQIARAGAFTRPAHSNDLQRAWEILPTWRFRVWWKCSTKAWPPRNIFSSRRFRVFRWNSCRRTSRVRCHRGRRIA